jgi:hypothetical protein
MNQNQPHPLDDLLEELLPKAAEVAVAVRDRDAQAVKDALAPLLEPADLLGLKGLIVVLAVLIPDDLPFGDLLAWTHGPHVPADLSHQLAGFDLHTTTKRCCGCRHLLPLDQFYPDPVVGPPDRRKSRCKACICAAARDQYAARDTNRSAIAASSGTDSGEAVAA